MDKLLENEAFCKGVAIGVCLHQQKVISAHKQKIPLKIGDTHYFLQDGRERLEELIDRVCK